MTKTTPRLGQTLRVMGLTFAHIGEEIYANVTEVTPKMAAGLLENMVPNRKRIAERVKRYLHEQTAGIWDLNGEPIIISNKGQLMNGANRCTACVQGGASFKTVMIYGIDPKTFRSQDTGKARTGADMLSVEGYQYASTLAAIGNFYWQIGGDGSALTSTRPEHTELSKLIRDHPGMVDSALAVYKFTWRPIKNAALGTLHYMCGRSNRKFAAEFFEKLDLGIEIKKNSPLQLLRTRLEGEFHSRARLDRLVMLALGVKTWNAELSGEPMRQLSWKADLEPFPKMK